MHEWPTTVEQLHRVIESSSIILFSEQTILIKFGSDFSLFWVMAFVHLCCFYYCDCWFFYKMKRRCFNIIYQLISLFAMIKGKKANCVLCGFFQSSLQTTSFWVLLHLWGWVFSGTWMCCTVRNHSRFLSVLPLLEHTPHIDVKLGPWWKLVVWVCLQQPLQCS
jgi:hypothetical protein